MNHAAALWISLVLLLLNAFFVGAEFAAMAARRSTLEPLAEQGSSSAARCLVALEQIGSLLATAQLGITICSVGIGALAEAALHEMLHPLFHRFGWSDSWSTAAALALALLIVVYLHVVVGEMIPKNVAIAGPDKAALLLVPALLVVAHVLRPLVRVMEALAKAMVRWLGTDPKDEIASAFTAQEVAHIVEESHREGLLPQDRQGLAAATLEFSDKVAHQVAVPLSMLTVVEQGATPQDVERLVARHGYSRYPVCDSAGELVGYLHLKDILYADDERYVEAVPAKRIRRLATVVETDEVEDVLATMQETGAHLARVVDRQGSERGIVFLEDVLEELVGEVTDATQR